MAKSSCSQVDRGSSGIGLAAARIFASKGAKVHVLDRVPIDWDFDIFMIPGQVDDDDGTRKGKLGGKDVDGTIEFHECDITNWKQLSSVLGRIPHVDIAVANAGVSEEGDYFADVVDEAGELAEPKYSVLDVNVRATVNFVKLALSKFGKQGPGGSLVVTASATAYSPEQSLPVYSASKLFLVGLIRSLRPSIKKRFGAVINGVAPAATISKLLPGNLAAPIIQAGAPVSSAFHVGLAVVFSATATQDRQVEAYGRDDPAEVQSSGRWNGRVIVTLGDRWTEVEEPTASLRSRWFGEWPTEMTAFQQKLTDNR
ncbi:Short-chain dehydrogenase reductase 3c [Colletotrichum tanaceti]|uniref:Short-chain dehydrogenase reductase 3c n=1 Tax=Colletotrichum tanaceti TaxID=1306861 RepID=A0A4V6DFW7_9PEZI|nr:Short-chain dehydrogenase reductase 3c [Colletotrichum tanaceti]TKW50066.1 Short-chain dehydrogenase reductase 3c [Colletotrichum tanaceti]